MQHTRNRPQLVTTIDPAMYKLLTREAARDDRPLSFVVDKFLRAGASLVAWANEVKDAR
jgi:hypothetical protein